jgi:hypothetical protein
MKQLQIFITKMILFFVFFAATYFAVLILLTNLKIGGNKLVYRAVQGLVWKGGYSYDRFREFDPAKKYDILIFGSSRANRGINPKRFEKAGLTVYNLGTDDQTPLNTCVLVKQFVKKDHCRLVILDIYDKVFSQDPLESNSDLIQNLNNDNDALKMALATSDMRAINQFGVRLLLHNDPPEYRAEGGLYNGYRALKENFHYSNDFHIYKRNEKHLKAFEEVLAYLKECNVPCLLICQPLPLKPLNHDLFISDLQPMLKKYDLQLYDFTENRKIVCPDGFADMSHLNWKGAERYSDFLLDSLVLKMLSRDEQVVTLSNRNH